MEKPITTIEALAAMINRNMASKEDIKELRTEMNQKFESVESRLGRIEHLLLAEQKREIEDLQKRMKRLEDALAVWDTPPTAGPPASRRSWPCLTGTHLEIGS